MCWLDSNSRGGGAIGWLVAVATMTAVVVLAVTMSAQCAFSVAMGPPRQHIITNSND